MKCERSAKTTAPTENPIKRPGQTCPLKLSAQYSVNFIKIYDIGNPIRLTTSGLFFNQEDMN